MEKFLTTYEKAFCDKAEKNILAEVELQEYLPGAVKIIRVRAVSTIEETELQKDGIFLRGCVKFTVVYLSDFKDRLKCASFSEEFTHTFPARGIGEVLSKDGLSDISLCTFDEKGHLLSPRRLALSCKVTIGVDALSACKNGIYGCNESEHLEMLCHKIDVLSLKKAGDFVISLRESISLEEGMPKIREIVCCDATLCNLSAEASDGEVVFSGEASLNCLYLGESEDDFGQYVSFNKCIPFSEKLPLAFAAADDFILCKGEATDVVATPVQDNYGESSLCSVSSEIKINARIYGNNEENVISDIFSTMHACDCEVREAFYDTLVCGICETVIATESVRAALGNITDIVSKSAEVCATSCEKIGNNLVYGIRVTLEICGTTASGALESMSTTFNLKVQGTKEICEVSERTRTDSSAYVHNCDCRIENGEIKCTLTLNICSAVYSRRSIRAVTAISTDTESSIHRDKSEYIIYYPEPSETVWSAAKKYRVSPKALLAVNGMNENDEVVAGRAVVIPRVKFDSEK